MTRKFSNNDDEFVHLDGMQRGYSAARDGMANYRNNRWWIDDATGSAGHGQRVLASPRGHPG